MSAARTLDEVTEPGLYPGMPDDVYLADPVPGGSLSHSGAKAILPPGCPALYRWQADHGRPDKAVFDFGRAAHRVVLGEGAEIARVDADDWRTKEARAARDEARARGLTPLLVKDALIVDDMAEALARNTLACELLAIPGRSEVAAFALDERDDVMLRAKYDRLPDPDDGRVIVTDYKTAPVADPDAFARSAWTYRYTQQAPWYVDLLKALGYADSIVFLFLIQAKEPPYLSFVAELPPEAMRYGRTRNREAIGLYADCRRRDVWGGPADDDVVLLDMPGWARNEMETYA